MVGFVNKDAVAYTTTADEGVCLRAWNTERGDVGRTLLLEANPAVPPVLTWSLSFKFS